MSKPPILTQICWPERYRKSKGFIVGWSIRGLLCTVIAVVNEPLQRVESALLNVEPKPGILGMVVGEEGKDESEIAAQKSVADIWFTVTIEENQVKLLDLSCCGYRYRICAHVIYYNNSDLSFIPYSLIWPRLLPLRSLQKYTTYKGERTDLELICDSINQASPAEVQLTRSLGYEYRKRPESRDSIFNLIVEEMIQLFSVLLEGVMAGYHWKLPWVHLGLENVPVRSYFGAHLKARAQEIQMWRENYRTRSLNQTCPVLAKKHIAAYLVAKDIQYKVIADFILGLSMLTLLYCYQESTLELVHVLGSGIHIEVLKSEIKWLMGLPAGFKPNVALDSALGSSILSFIDYWNYITTFLTSFEPDIVLVLALFGTFGASFQLALFADLVDFCSIHVYYIYRLVSSIYFLQMDVMLSLFRLATGYKKNVLKNRVDRGEFGIDEVLLGTLIFTGLIFLYPTIAMYYLCFVGIWLGIVMLQLALRLVYVCVCFFPYHTLGVYSAGNFLFPGGVYFTVNALQGKQVIPTAYLQMKSQRYPLGYVFADLLGHLKQLLRPFPAVFNDILRGNELKPAGK